jgi:hypothetical protein
MAARRPHVAGVSIAMEISDRPILSTDLARPDRGAAYFVNGNGSLHRKTESIFQARRLNFIRSNPQAPEIFAGIVFIFDLFARYTLYSPDCSIVAQKLKLVVPIRIKQNAFRTKIRRPSGYFNKLRRVVFPPGPLIKKKMVASVVSAGDQNEAILLLPVFDTPDSEAV